jgi:RNA polymerase sigma-70 factor, ECF subfamily
MPAPADPLDALMARLADGDRSAFRPVFERLWPPIQRLCGSLLHQEADAADAAQEAMQKILARAPADYDRTRPALPWALAIAGWECRTLLRKRLRRRESAGLESAGLESAGPSGGDPEREFVQRDLARAALEALGELSESDREALLASFWEEAASVSGATLRKRRERALERLRSAFRRLYGLD